MTTRSDDDDDDDDNDFVGGFNKCQAKENLQRDTTMRSNYAKGI